MKKSRPTLCIVAGPNGSGKTTTTLKLLANEWAANAAEAISLVDRAYIYDNSVEDTLPQLLYRTKDGRLFKQYVEEIPAWAQILL